MCLEALVELFLTFHNQEENTCCLLSNVMGLYNVKNVSAKSLFMKRSLSQVPLVVQNMGIGVR